MQTQKGMAERYKAASDAELQELAQCGQSDFTPVAWDALRAEIAARALTPETTQVKASGVADRWVAMDGGKGIGGWLAVFVIHQSLTPLAFIAGAVLSGSPGPSWLTLAMTTHVFAVGFGLRLILIRSAHAPVYWIGLLLAQIVWAMFVASNGSMTGAGLFRNTVWPGVWILYWIFSKRVQATLPNADLKSGDVSSGE